jgi:hypothetical protein
VTKKISFKHYKYIKRLRAFCLISIVMALTALLLAMPGILCLFLARKASSSTLLTDDTSTITVTRRFRDFEWLHLTLKRIFPSVVVVAGLPSKWFDGLEKRRGGELQRYLNALCRHPLVRSCEVFMIFLYAVGGEYEEGKSQYEIVLAGEVGDKTATFFKRVYEMDLFRDGVYQGDRQESQGR